MERRFPLRGLYAIVEDPRALRQLAVVGFALPTANVAVLGVVAWAFNEPVLAAVLAVLVVVYLAVFAVAWRVPRTSLTLLISMWGSLLSQVAAHVILGGYLYSGGYLLFGITVVVAAGGGLSRRMVEVFGAVYAVTAVGFGLGESSLRAARDAPDPALPIILIIDVFLVTLAMLGPAFVDIVGRLSTEHARNRELMLSILPQSIADRLKEEPGMIADRYGGCSIVFADLVGFTSHSKGRDATEIVAELNTIFTRFDALTTQHGAEKIKTIGDGYMAATGLPDPDPDHVAHAGDLALDMLDALPGLNAELGTDFTLRVGVHTGPAVAGIVGTSKFSYDVWGDTVNLASRMESNGAPGKVAISAAVAAALDDRHHAQLLGVTDIKGQGPTEIYRLTRPTSALV